MDKKEAGKIILEGLQFYLESAQTFVSYDELIAMKKDVENACSFFGIKAPDVYD